MKTSIFDLFKIGIGPSSSHTVGPMRAARRFVLELERTHLLGRVRRVRSELYGSLALTGIGHGTDRAVLLGLSGEKPEEVDPPAVESLVGRIRSEGVLRLLGVEAVDFREERDLLFHRGELLPGHSNGMRFSAFDAAGELLQAEIFYSIGGGFIAREGEAPGEARALPVRHPFANAAELLAEAETTGLPVWRIMLENESDLRSEAEVRSGLLQIWAVMNSSIDRGLATEGILPGGLNVRRRAPRLWRRLEARAEANGGTAADPLVVMDRVNVFAMAVNEENAAGGRVVTAPTNGAAGLIPAVGRYYCESLAGASKERTGRLVAVVRGIDEERTGRFVPVVRGVEDERTGRSVPVVRGVDEERTGRFVPVVRDIEEGLLRYLLTAGAIGILYKENASISGAEVGCQGEVGVACSMAAAGLAGALEGTTVEVEHAAEIGMEHHLGMTCDPIGGLVQIPCIERNAFGAVKAINACRMAMQEAGGHKVSLDQVIRTMYQTGLDMQSRYKETALAGLAVNVKDC